MTQILKIIKSWYGRGNNAWDGASGLDLDLVHIDNHLGGIKFSGVVSTGTAASATPGILGVAKLFTDGSYAVTNADAGGNLIAMAYPAIQGLMASDGFRLYINTGSGWSSPSSATFTSVPGNDVGQIITVTAPHLRQMVWNGTAYVRAPWHQPGMVQYSIDNPASIPGYLPVRGDVVYAQSNYPDLIARLGLSGVGNFSLVELRGEFIRCLDNGRGVDAGRSHASSQTANAYIHMPGALSGNPLSNGYGTYDLPTNTTIGVGMNLGSGETRPRNVALPAWVSY
jgi:hypothetical protein